MEHGIIHFLSRHSGRQNIPSEEIASVKIIGIHSERPILRLITPHYGTESVDFKRHLNTATEHYQRKELANSLIQVLVHRTRPVNKHNEAVVLARSHRSDPTEQVVIILVRMKLVSVNHASLGNASAAIFIGRLSHFKFLDHKRHTSRFISLELLELAASRINPSLAILRSTNPLFSQNLLIINYSLAIVNQLRQPSIDILKC